MGAQSARPGGSPRRSPRGSWSRLLFPGERGGPASPTGVLGEWLPPPPGQPSSGRLCQESPGGRQLLPPGRRWAGIPCFHSNRKRGATLFPAGRRDSVPLS